MYLHFYRTSCKKVWIFLWRVYLAELSNRLFTFPKWYFNSNFWLESGFHFHGLQAKKFRVFCDKPFRDCCQNWSPRFHKILSDKKGKRTIYQFLFLRLWANLIRMFGEIFGWFAKTAFKRSRGKFWRKKGFQKKFLECLTLSWCFAGFWQKMGRVIKTALYVSRGYFRR